MHDRKPLPKGAVAVLAGLSDLDPVSAQPVELEIRSGIHFLFRDALKRGVPPETQQEIGDNIDKGILLNRFIAEWGFDVAHEHADAFHAWLAANEKYIARYCPTDVQYRGTYAVMSGEKRSSGQYRTIWTFSTFGAMQNLSEELGDKSSALRRLLDEFSAFRKRGDMAAEAEWMLMPAAAAYRL